MKKILGLGYICKFGPNIQNFNYRWLAQMNFKLNLV